MLEYTKKELKEALIEQIKLTPYNPGSLCTDTCDTLGVSIYDAGMARSNTFLRLRDIQKKMEISGELIYWPHRSTRMNATKCLYESEFPGQIKISDGTIPPTLINSGSL